MAIEMNTFTIYNAKSQFSKLLSRVELGEEIIISNRGVAVARLVPVENKRSRSRSMGVVREASALPNRGLYFVPSNFNNPLPPHL
jgi:prevent-host-death family protein